MRRLPKLWRSLEQITGLLEVPAAWEAACGEDFGFLRPYLRPTEMVGRLYPCPHRYGECPRKIVDYLDGEFAAICRDPHQSCERIPLAPRDALLHDLDLGSFFKPVAEATSIRTEIPKPRGHGLWSVGLSGRRSSLNQPAFLVIAHGVSDFEASIRELLVEVPGQFLLVVPTNRWRSVEVQEWIQARGITYLCLEEQIGVDNAGAFVSIEPLESVGAAPVTPVGDRKCVIAAFRAKHKCKVVEIHEAAAVHEADYYKWLNGSIPDHYSTCVAIEKVLANGLPERRKRTLS